MAESKALSLFSGSKASAAQLDAAVLEFQFPSTAIINAPVPVMARNTTWVVTSAVLAMIVIMGLIPVDQVVVARGIVVSEHPTVLVQPLETAIVRSIEVREGERVQKGQLLAKLDPTFAKADLGALTKQISNLEAELARLNAEAEGYPYDAKPHGPAGELQLTIFNHRQGELKAKLETYDQKLDQLTSMRDRATSDANAYRQRLGVAEDIEKMRRELEAKQVGTRINTLAAVDARTEMQRALGSAEKTAEGAGRDMAALQSERSAFLQNWRGDISQKQTDVERRLNELRESETKAQLRRDLVELRSDKDGIVQSLAKVSVGSVLQSGQPFISLVPTDGTLQIEANVPGKENGFVHVGNEVSVKFDTLPFSQYGMARGTVRVMSPDAFTLQGEQRNPTGAVPLEFNNEPFYRARISLDDLALHDLPQGFRIIPGMPVTADVKIGKRTVLSYLMGRVVPVAQEGMREP